MRATQKLVEKEVSALPPFDPDLIAEKLVEFAELISGIGYYNYQKPAMKKIFYDLLTDGGNMLTILFSRQSGKTEAIAGVIATSLVMFPALGEIYPELAKFKRGFYVGTFAPLRDLVSTMLSRVSLRISTEMFSDITAGMSIDIERRNPLTLSNGSILKGHTLNSKLESFTYHLAVIDEAQDAPDDKIKNGILPMLSATNGTTVMIGTCALHKSFFYSTILENQKEAPELHYEANWKRAAEENPYYKKFVTKMRKKLGADSIAFLINYELVWLFEEGQLISELALESMYNTSLRMILTLSKPEIEAFLETLGDYEISVGIDAGKKRDSTVVTVIARSRQRNEYIILGWLELLGDNYNSQLAQIIEFLRLIEDRIACIVVDSTGVGEALKDMITEAYRDKPLIVIPFTFGRSTKSDGYRNFISVLHDRTLVIPAHFSVRKTKVFRRFKEQMLDVQKEWSGAFLDVKHPNKDSGHDDFPDSCMLAIWGFRDMEVVTWEATDGEELSGYVRNSVRRRRRETYVGEVDAIGRPIRRKGTS